MIDIKEKMTIKEVADLIGGSKDKVRYRMKKVPPQYIVKENDVHYITKQGVELILKDVGITKHSSDTVLKNDNNTHDTHNDNEILQYKILLLENENILLKENISNYKSNSELLKNELDIKNEQIFELTERLKEITNALLENQKLISQQQTLALVDKKENVKSEVPDSEIKNNVPDNKISFWNRIFKRK